MDGGFGWIPDDPEAPGARATGRAAFVQHLYSTTPGSAPPSGLLTVGELGLELATPAKIWVGVPTSMDPTGRRLLLDTANAGGIGEAPEDGQVYGRQGVNHVWLPALPLSGGTLTGDITIKPASGGAAIHLDSPGPGWPAVTWNAQVAGIAAAYFQSARYGKARWSVEFGGTQAESGVAEGTDFLINRFANDGSVIYPSPLGIKRSTGVVTVATALMLAGDPTAPLQAVPRQYLDNNYSTNTQGDLRWVNVTGDDMSGRLKIVVPDNYHAMLLTGPVVGIRFIAYADGMAIEGVDPTGATTYQPLSIGGSAIKIQASTTVASDATFTLGQQPTAPMHAVPRKYLDDNYLTITQADLRYVNVTGDTMTGPLIVGEVVTVGRGALNPPPASINTDLHVVGRPTGGSSNITLTAWAGGTQLIQRRANGTSAAPLAIAWNDALMSYRTSGYDGTNWTLEQIAVSVFSEEAWTPTAQGRRTSLWTVPIGGTAHVERLRIDASGIVMIGQTVPLNAAKLQVNGGVSLGEFEVAGDYDLSRHLLIYDGGANHQYGLNVQWNGTNPAHFNYVAGMDAVHQFLIEGAGLIATFQPAGLLMSLNHGIDFGTTLAANDLDLSRHLSLFNFNHGVNVSARGLNIVGGATYFINDGITVAGLSSGQITFNVGLSFGNVTTPSGRPTDLTRHLSLFGGGADGSYGFSITNNRLNIVSPSITYFSNGGNDIGWFDGNGLGFLGFYTATLGRLATADMEAVPLKQLSSNLALYVAKSGDTMTGTLHLRPGAFLQMDDTVGNGFRFIMGGDDNLTVTGTNTDGSNRILWDVHMRQDGAPIRHYADIELVTAASLRLHHDAATIMEAVPLRQLTTSLGNYVARAGDTMTGTLHLIPGAYMQMDDTFGGTGFRFLLGGDNVASAQSTNTNGSARLLWTLQTLQDGAAFRHYANIQMVSGAKLFLYDIPTTDDEAANKKYVDGTVTRAGGPFLPLTAGPGMALTGMLYLPHVTPTVDEQATPKFYVDAADQNLQAQISAVVSGNLVFYGQLDVANDVVHYKYTIAIPDSPMPPPTSVPKGGYIIVTTGGIPGTGTNIPPLPPGTPQYVRGDWFISDGEIWIFLPTGLVYFTADAVEVSPPIQGTVNVQDTLQWLHDNKLNIAGGTLTGQLYHPFTPSTGTMVANKAYVDSQISSGAVTSFNLRVGAVVLSPADVAGATGLLRTGGTMVGDLLLNSDPTADLMAATRRYVDGSVVHGVTAFNDRKGDVYLLASDVAGATGLLRTGGTMVGELLLASDPTAPLMAATRQYVDAINPINKYLLLTGGTMSGGISFGQGIPASENPTDTSRHITLWQPGLGFSVTPYRINYVVDTLTSHVFLVGGADVLAISSGGLGMKTGYDITLSRDPTQDMHAVNKRWVDAQMSGYLKLTGGNMTGDILMTGQTRVNFFNGSGYIGNTGMDRADILGVNLALGSWHGLGFTTTCPGQVIPQGLYGVAIGTREGYLEAVKFAVMDGRLNVPTQIQMLSIYHDAGPNQIIETNVNCYRPSIASIADGGGSVNVGDRFYDDHGNIYTALAVSGGGVTSLRMDNSRATLYGAGAPQVGLHPIAGSVGFNVKVNLTWTRPNYLILQHTYGALSLYGSTRVDINGGSYGVYINSPLRPQQGINFDNAVSGSPQDTSKGITFFGAATGPSYGIVVTGSTLNYNVYDTNNRHDFYAGGTLLFRIWGTDWVRSYLPFSAVNGIQVDGAPGNGAGLVLNQRGGQSQLWGYSNYSARWMIKMASNDEGADATGTTGSAFEVHAYGNDGHYVGQALFIMRAEGRGGDVSFNGYGYIAYDPWQPTSIVNKRWVEANYTTTAAGDARWVNTSGDEITGQLVVTGTTFANGNFIFNFRNDGTSWPVGGYGALGWNVSGGWGEVNFVNACSWAPGGFDWKQVTGNGTWKTLMTMRNDGNLWLSGVGMNYGGLTGSGNLMGFTWASDGSANRVKVWVDGSDQGFLATQSFTDGRYLKLTGGIVTGHTDFSPAISVYGPSAYFWFKPDWEGGWNPIAAVGDNVIFSRKSSGPNIGVLTLTLWNDTALGIRIDGGANTIAMHAANGITITNSLKIANNTGNLNFKDASGGDNFMIMGSDNHFGFYATRANGTQNTIFDFYARSDAPIFQFWLPVTLTTNNTVTLGRDPTANMEAVTRQWVVNNYAPLVGGGYVAKTGDAMSGPLQINWTPTDTAAQLWLRPLGGNDGRSVIRFGATFASPIGDTGPRYVSSIRAGMTGGWVTEYLDIWINNQMNDANSDANQRRIARFTQSRLSIEGDGADPLYITVPNNNWARVFYTVTGTRTWGAGLEPGGHYVVTDEGVPAVRFRIDTNGNAAFYNALNVGAGFYATGGVSGDVIDARNGKFMVASNPDYYFQRHPATAVWSIVEGARTVFMVEPNLDHTYGTGTFPGHLKVSNNLSVGNVLNVGNYVAALRLQLNSGDGSGQNAQNQIALSYSNTGQYTHWITTHHFAQSPGRHIDNSIDFWLCDGTGPGVFPTNAYRALSVSSLQITAGVPVVLPADPVGTMEAATRRYVDNKFIPITGGDYVKKSGDTMTAALQVGTGIGYTRLEPGTATNSGYLGFHSSDGTRRGYIGNATAGGVELAVDAGVTLLSLVAPTVWMNGVASLTTGTIYRSFSSNIIGFGWDGTNGYINLYVDGTYQHGIAAHTWVINNFKSISAYTPNQMVDTTSGPTFGSVMNTSGTFYVGGNAAYYLGRNAANGDWLFVENSQWNFQVHADGQSEARNCGIVGEGGIKFARFGSANSFLFYHDGLGNVRGWVDNNAGTDYLVGSWSDRRLKREIEPSTLDCLDIVNKLPLKQYRWRRQTTPVPDVRREGDDAVVPVGLVAQEVGAVFPSGAYPGLKLEDGGEGWWQLNNQSLVAALIGAVQQLTERVKTLEQQRMH